MTISKINGIAIQQGVTTTEIVPLIDPIYNNSSAGQTYTDVAGDTYAELTNQTRITMPTERSQQVQLVGSGHVDAGTGTFQIYNFTDGSSLNTRTTTATSETVFPQTQGAAVSTNDGDDITIRVKNSGAGNTITLDFGGLATCDGYVQTNGTASFNDVSVFSTTGLSSGNFVCKNIKALVLKRHSTATFSVEFGKFLRMTSDITGTKYEEVFATYTDSDSGTVQTVPLTGSYLPGGSSLHQLRSLAQVTAASDSSALGIAITCDAYDINY